MNAQYTQQMEMEEEPIDYFLKDQSGRKEFFSKNGKESPLPTYGKVNGYNKHPVDSNEKVNDLELSSLKLSDQQGHMKDQLFENGHIKNGIVAATQNEKY